MMATPLEFRGRGGVDVGHVLVCAAFVAALVFLVKSV